MNQKRLQRIVVGFALGASISFFMGSASASDLVLFLALSLGVLLALAALFFTAAWAVSVLTEELDELSPGTRSRRPQ